MLEIKHRFSVMRFIYLFSLAVLTAGLASCHDVASDEDSEAPAEAREVVITADSIAKLAPGEKLIVDPASDTAYTFDFAAAPIDFSRIAIVADDGRQMPMDRWLSSSEYGKKLLASPNRTFRLGANKQTLNRLPSLKERNVKLLQKDSLTCIYTYIEIVVEVTVCDLESGICVTVVLVYIEETLECWDDPEP